MSDVSEVQLKESEMVKVETADKIDEPKPASVKLSYIKMIAENIAKEISAQKKLRKRTKKINEAIAKDREQELSPSEETTEYIAKIKKAYAEGNDQDIPPRKKTGNTKKRKLINITVLPTTIKRNKKQTEQIKDIKKTGRQKTPLIQSTQIVETKTRDNDNKNQKNDSLNKIEVNNDSSDGNQNEKVNVIMPNAKTANLKTKKEVNSNKKPLAKARSTAVPKEVSLERLSSGRNSIRENPDSSGISKVDAKTVTVRAIIERPPPIIGNKAAHNKKRKLQTPASERPLVANTAQNKNLELVTPCKFLKNNCGRRLASRRESSVSERIKEVDPRPKVPLSEHIEAVTKIALEKVETRLKEIQSGNTERMLNMCAHMDKKLDEVVETQRNDNAQTMDALEKRFCYEYKKENERATKRWKEALNGLREEFKTKSRDLLEKDERRSRLFMTLLRDEIDNMGKEVNDEKLKENNPQNNKRSKK